MKIVGECTIFICILLFSPYNVIINALKISKSTDSFPGF